MTPLEFTILLHHHCSPGPFRQPTALYDDICAQFTSDGIFETSLPADQRENGYKVTDKGTAWILAILKTPMPEQVWVDLGGEILEIS